MKTTILYLILALYAMHIGSTSPLPPVELYNTHCKRCHGSKGERGFPLAKRLDRSQLDSIKAMRIITAGTSRMPSFKRTLNHQEIASMAGYIQTFKNQ